MFQTIVDAVNANAFDTYTLNHVVLSIGSVAKEAAHNVNFNLLDTVSAIGGLFRFFASR